MTSAREVDRATAARNNNDEVATAQYVFVECQCDDQIHSANKTICAEESSKRDRKRMSKIADANRRFASVQMQF